MMSGYRSIAIVLLCAVLGLAAGCSRKTDPVDGAKVFVEQAMKDDKQAGRVAGLDSERYLPVQERLKRRQERIGVALASQTPAVDARQP